MRTTKSGRSSQSVTGSQEPTVRIAPHYRESDGGDADRILKSGGVVLDPWQADILMDWMALNGGR